MTANRELILSGVGFFLRLQIAVHWANDVAVAIGETVSGSEGAFVQRMNQEAQRLGMTSTRFVNPTGLPATG